MASQCSEINNGDTGMIRNNCEKLFKLGLVFSVHNFVSPIVIIYFTLIHVCCCFFYFKGMFLTWVYVAVSSCIFVSSKLHQ